MSAPAKDSESVIFRLLTRRSPDSRLSAAFVKVAYLLNVAPSEHPEQRTFLVAIGVAREHAERAARASITMLQAAIAKADIPLDLTSFDPDQDLPEYLCHPGAMRFFGPRT